jgi:arginine/ornithine N-succinyltransferase beta subunit
MHRFVKCQLPNATVLNAATSWIGAINKGDAPYFVVLNSDAQAGVAACTVFVEITCG